ncbi:Nudix hydrolase [Actinidia chinensis var. chinensis]|uniref:Nudix hydrolase n=1 Tax=Actinidia chinensis var. chinensis TaxID=1590841 RepID=A0A2R6RB25_ACTCC|nr:Nudix hydrolase [Actinidia chinensis var. chinensis]
MIRSLFRPSLLCSTARNLRHFSKHPFLTVRLKYTPEGISRIKVRFGGEFNINSMAAPASRAMEQMVSENEEQEQISKLLTGMNDEHGGVVVEMTTEPMDAHVFASSLRASISHWRQQGKKGVWIKLPIELVNLVEPAVKEGFYFHHAEPKYLMLVHWIPKTANTLPANATHRVGIGAFVMNEKNEVLVVQEKSGVFRGTGVWKFPTGVVDEGEDICDAAVREVKEETGIDTNFMEILAFRQSHQSFFEKSDLFFVCLLQPLSFDIQMQESEIEAAQWMPFEEYLSQHFVQKNELLKYIADICLTKREGKYSGFCPMPTTTSFSDKKSYLYLDRQFLKSP